MFNKKKIAFEMREKEDMGDPIEQMKKRMAKKASGESTAKKVSVDQ